MGTVAELLAHAQRDLDDAETAQARDLRRIIGKTKLAPESLHRIISLRNKAIHRERSAVEVRAAAEEFCDEVERQVVQWQRRDGGFPTQAVVEEVRFDRWGRRTMVVSVDGEEMTVFTDRDLQPGQSYLMKHFTNPWSIDPVIVEGVSLPSDPDPRS
jgi:hypothetical protein